MQERPFQIGDTVITKVLDLHLNDFTVEQLLPGVQTGVQTETLMAEPGGFDSRTYDPKSGKVSLSVHTWVVRHEGKILLIDTAAGNGKNRPQLKVLDHLDTPYLERLQNIGVQPDQVDYILLTHIHADHVGWNTVQTGGRWKPTFPKATVICSDREWRYSAALASEDKAADAIRKETGFGESKRLPTPGVFSDSMAPIEAEGKLQRIAINGDEVLKGIRFLPTPGHSIDHAAISITSQGHPGHLWRRPGASSVRAEGPRTCFHVLRVSRSGKEVSTRTGHSRRRVGSTLLQQPLPGEFRWQDHAKRQQLQMDFC